MNGRIARLLPLTLLLAAGGCELVGNIIQFGFWVGAIVVIVALGLIMMLVRAFRR